MSLMIKPVYDLVVYIGRFSPFHCGHEVALKKAFELGENVLMLIGSADEPRTILNPWTYEERRSMILTWKEAARGNGLLEGKGYDIMPLHDDTYNNHFWVANVQKAVAKAVRSFNLGDNPKIALIGADSDETTYYLHIFPKWKTILLERENVKDWTSPDVSSKPITATAIREIYFSDLDRFCSAAGYFMPIPVMKKMLEFARISKEYATLATEYKQIRIEQEKWKGSPYPVNFQTVDSVVVQSGHVLLVKREGPIGKDKWALPGGFLEPGETLLDGAIRELREEAGLKVPVPVLKGSIAAKGTFDNPRRSQLGRIITRAFLFQLKDEFELPHVKGASDAKVAKWVPLNEFLEMRSVMFDDHFHIINSLIRKV